VVQALARAQALGLSAYQHLALNNAYEFFQPLEDFLITGPTRTNVMDLQILLVDGWQMRKICSL